MTLFDREGWMDWLLSIFYVLSPLLGYLIVVLITRLVYVYTRNRSRKVLLESTRCMQRQAEYVEDCKQCLCVECFPTPTNKCTTVQKNGGNFYLGVHHKDQDQEKDPSSK